MDKVCFGLGTYVLKDGKYNESGVIMCPDGKLRKVLRIQFEGEPHGLHCSVLAQKGSRKWTIAGNGYLIKDAEGVEFWNFSPKPGYKNYTVFNTFFKGRQPKLTENPY